VNFSVVIPSKNPTNCIACIGSIFEREPDLPRERIVVVDDGARVEAETELSGITWLNGVKPFVFARNCNIGLRYAFDEQGSAGAVLLNDDTRLLTDGGFGLLAEIAESQNAGILSAVLVGSSGNPKNLPVTWIEERTVAYICVFIPRKTWEAVGELDETFCTGYGWEDNDFNRRVRRIGLKLLVSGVCLVEHGRLPSTFRPEHFIMPLEDSNARIYYDKWGDLEVIAVPPEWRKVS
jgi:GT2 family glycosyltransferase